MGEIIKADFGSYPVLGYDQGMRDERSPGVQILEQHDCGCCKSTFEVCEEFVLIRYWGLVAFNSEENIHWVCHHQIQIENESMMNIFHAMKQGE